ncbi:MAG: DUF4389 domain-containing protein [Spirochaetes bacterium]|nr:DUF4389 domain-containing protein [Spirochaetota bacterium]
MDKGELKNNLKNAHIWSRIFYMFLFMIIYGIAEAVFYFLVLFQIFYSIITGKPEARIRQSGSDLTLYMYDILQFLIMKTDEKPFPFNDWKKDKPSGN